MSESTDSFLKVHYELRPSKQVERRMIVDALLILASEGFPVRDYHYTGMGSVYFVDFIMLHKLVGISEMASYEMSEKAKLRAPFNSPYGLVKVFTEPVGNGVAKLSPDAKHLLWLDYDDVLSSGMMGDIALAGSRLPLGSIILVTVDGEGPGPDSDGPEQWFGHYKREAGGYLDPGMTAADFGYSKLPLRAALLIEAAVKSGLSTRRGVAFRPMFNFVYKDGHRMLTVGGMIVSDTEVRRMSASAFNNQVYARDSFEKPPFVIRVPRLTRRERIHLDAAMPSAPDWIPREFEMDTADVAAYRDIYRFFPAYAELLL